MQTLNRNGLKIFHSPELLVHAKSKGSNIYRIKVNGALLPSMPIQDDYPFSWDLHELHTQIQVLVLEKIKDNVIQIIQNPDQESQRTFYAKTNIVVRYGQATALQVHDDLKNIDIYKLFSPLGAKAQIINDTNMIMTIDSEIYLNNKELVKIKEHTKELKKYLLPPLTKAITLTKVTEEFYQIQIRHHKDEVIERYIDSSRLFNLEYGSSGHLLEKYLPAKLNIQKIASCIRKEKFELLYVQNANDDNILDPDLSHVFYNHHGAAILSKQNRSYPRFRYIPPVENEDYEPIVCASVKPQPFFISELFIIEETEDGFKINCRPTHLIRILKPEDLVPESVQQADFQEVWENINWLTDILRDVILYLTEEEKVLASRVCKQWHRSVKQVNAEALDKLVSLFKKTSWRKVKSEGKNLSFVIW